MSLFSLYLLLILHYSQNLRMASLPFKVVFLNSEDLGSDGLGLEMKSSLSYLLYLKCIQLSSSTPKFFSIKLHPVFKLPENPKLMSRSLNISVEAPNFNLRWRKSIPTFLHEGTESLLTSLPCKRHYFPVISLLTIFKLLGR